MNATPDRYAGTAPQLPRCPPRDARMFDRAKAVLADLERERAYAVRLEGVARSCGAE